MALQACDRADHDVLLRAEQSRCRGLRGQGLSRHTRLQAGRSRSQDRQEGVADRHRRPRARLQRDHGADRRERQGADRHERRRIRRSRFRARVRRQGRQAHLEFPHHPGELGRRLGGEGRYRPPHAPKHPGREGPARQDRRSLQDAGRRRVAEPGGRSGEQPHLFRGRQSLARSRRLAAARRQSLHQLAGLPRARYRQICLPLPVHRPRRVGSRRRQPADPDRRPRQEPARSFPA